MKHPPQKTFLALGDSYTIGESVPIYESFPYQTVQLLRHAGLSFNAAEIVAKTGWTTDELQQGMADTVFQSSYDVVTLLIGVNNQYRGKRVTEYAASFEYLLKRAIDFCKQKESGVFVLSIPDWGVTPFAKGRDSALISHDIDSYNECNNNITRQYQATYIDITPGTRQAAADETLLAADNLHPSGKEYARWAKKLASAIIERAGFAAPFHD